MGLIVLFIYLKKKLYWILIYSVTMEDIINSEQRYHSHRIYRKYKYINDSLKVSSKVKINKPNNITTKNKS